MAIGREFAHWVRSWGVLALLILAGIFSPPAWAAEETLIDKSSAPPLEPAEPAPLREYIIDPLAPSKKSNAYPDGDFVQHINSPGAPGSSCSSEKKCDWGWGCGGSPYRTGPGRCDNWRVGPIWEFTIDGLVIEREGTNLTALIAESNGNSTDPDPAVELTEDFARNPGVRLSANARWPQNVGYELQVMYWGVPEWNASAVFAEEQILGPPPNPPAAPATFTDVFERRTLAYRSSLHSLEVNFQRTTTGPLEVFYGIRYILLDEDIEDRADQYGPAPNNANEFSITTDLLTSVVSENNLIGFQSGIRRDMWKFKPWLFLEGFFNGGIYCNVIEQTRVETEIVNLRVVNAQGNFIDNSTFTTSTIRSDRAEVAWAGEISLAAVCKLNRCCALRGGYQAMYLDGVELADAAFLNPTPPLETESMLFHGWFAGFEYRR